MGHSRVSGTPRETTEREGFSGYFKSRPALGAPDIDGWRGKDMIAPIFMSGDTELQEKLRRHVMVPYIMESFIPEHKRELAGATSFAYLKPNGVDVRPLAEGSAWRRAAASAANAPAAPRGAASPLQLPQLNSLAQPASSGRADGAAASSSRLPKQKRVTQQIMPRWMPHVQANQAPPVGAGMGEGDQSRKLSYSPKPAA